MSARMKEATPGSHGLNDARDWQFWVYLVQMTKYSLPETMGEGSDEIENPHTFLWRCDQK